MRKMRQKEERENGGGWERRKKRDAQEEGEGVQWRVEQERVAQRT